MKNKLWQHIDEVYNKLIDVAFFDRALEEIRPFIDEDFIGYGTAEDEFLKGWEGLSWMVNRQKEEIGDEDVSLVRNIISKRLYNEDQTALIVEEFEFSTQTNEGIHRFVVRLSTMLGLIENHWAILHFHGSLPDNNTPQGNAWPIEEWKRKNAELETIVKEKTATLIARNRALEIETALERVRARSMAMHSSKELGEVAKVMFDQMQSLGGDLYAFGVVLCDKDADVVEQWHGLGEAGIMTPFHVSVDLDYIHRYRYDQWKAGVDLFSIEIPSDYIQEHFERMFKLPSVQAVKEELESKGIELTIPDWEIDYGASFRYGYLLISSLKPFEEEDLFPRFAQVFEQAYTRFIDLQNAEAQAREARVEVALERVRSRTMAMQKSEELPEVVHVMYEQLKPFEIGSSGIELILCNEQTGNLEFWDASIAQSLIPRKHSIGHYGHPFFKRQWKAWKRQDDRLVVTLKGRKKREFDDYIFSETEFQHLPKDVIDFIRSTKVDVFSHAIMKYGLLESVDSKPLSEEKFYILERFAQVFEQTYTRFLDLQKAEGQAREAQIEAALERVRAASMAMHTTGDLNNIIATVFTQLRHLGFDNVECEIILFDPEKLDCQIWPSNEAEHILPRSYHIPYNKYKFYQFLLNSWRSGKDYFPYELKGMTKKAWENWLFNQTDWKNIPLAVQKSMQEVKKVFLYGATTSHGILEVGGLQRLEEEMFEIIQRFAKVFEQSYTRFLDLKKAEAQSRESEIELSLEKVRSRTMAMQASGELGEVSQMVFKEMNKLGLSPNQVVLATEIADCKRGFYLWIAANQPSGEISLLKTYVPYFKNPINDSVIKAIQNGTEFYKEQIDKKVKNAYLLGFSKYSKFKLPKDRLEMLLNYKSWHRSIAISEHVLLQMGRYDGEEYSEHENDMLIRFNKVLNQTYTRFLDLQKAEAQTREAKIEAALERVRARTMAMHRSDELKEVIAHTFNQLQSLNFIIDFSTFHIEEEGSRDLNLWVASRKENYAHQIRVPYFDHPAFTMIDRFKETGEPLQYSRFSKSENWSFYNHAFTKSDLKNLVTPERQKKLLNMPGQDMLAAMSNNSALQVSNFKDHAYTEQEQKIVLRFANVFDQAYTRFLELQKAEAQAREAQIEAALERVRAASMAMHMSKDLHKVINVVYNQLADLGLTLHSAQIWDTFNDKNTLHIWNAGKDQDYPEQVHIPVTKNVFFTRFYAAIKNDESFYTQVLSKRQKDNVFKHYFENAKNVNVPKPRQDFIYSRPGLAISAAIGKDSMVTVMRFDAVPYLPSENEILKRFGKVFDQSYTRFLDLQKAEKQAREAQIEAGLERVRSRSMAMHQSEELHEVVTTVFEQLKNLGLKLDSTLIHIFQEEDKEYHWWAAASGQNYSRLEKVPVIDHPFFKNFNHAHDSGIKIFSDLLSKKDKNTFFEHLFLNIEGNKVPKERRKFIRDKAGIARSVAFMQHTAFIMMNYDAAPYSSEENNILLRFASVFEQSYTRFLDLKKAEAQTKEALIEAALEKVRATSLAMHESKDLHKVIVTVYNQLEALGLKINSTHIVESIHDEKVVHLWSAANGQIYPKQIHIPYSKNIFFTRFKSALENRESFYTMLFTKRQKDDFFRHYFNKSTHQDVPKSRQSFIFSTPGIGLSVAVGQYTCLTVWRYDGIPYKEDENEIIKRFAQVFEQIYTRFLDLQKAEAQAREAQIEAALERVRSRAMAMHNSEELVETSSLLFEQLSELGLKASRVGFGTFHDEGRLTKIWGTAKDSSGKTKFSVGEIEENSHPLPLAISNAWREKKAFTNIMLEGKELSGYYMSVEKTMNFPTIYRKELLKKKESEWYNTYFFDAGFIFAITKKALPHEESYIMQRFAQAFDLTYKRFLDIKQAEAQAKEAMKQAALDRVRGEIASMRSTEDLNRITPVIWRELMTMGVPFIRCGVFIVDEKKEVVNAYLSSPDGQALGVLHLPFNINTQAINTVKFWKEKKVYKEHWNRQDFINWTNSMVELGQLDNVKSYQGSKEVPDSLYLHFIPFRQGMLYVGNTHSLIDEKIVLVETLAKAFSIAYARYEDFKNLEEAKSKIEITLNELKATQAQLIHSEKMASLGELTAGIAHEIQNPLNFVNNFSEVSSEMVEEMRDEIKSGDLDEVEAISLDLKQNLEKIHHHGKRAESIVKGMLMHSRTSKGEKVPTDINALCDEFLRLSYHGLRAKDRTFNAEFITDFDETLPKINVIPQDMGRVMLNLFNNAFQACAEKPHQGLKALDGGVKVSTKNLGDQIEITVSDNGPGIPEDIKDKIFQPFFTTKPTGQGTGLGLSLAYDIVKAHGGELVVKSEIGNMSGSEFTIKLPA